MSTTPLTDISFFVAGIPTPHGRMKRLDPRIGKQFISGIYEGTQDTIWKAAIALEATPYLKKVKFQNPVFLGISFYFITPSTRRTGQHCDMDAIKLQAYAEAVIDTLVEIKLLPKPGAIAELCMEKLWAKANPSHEGPGALIEIKNLGS